MQMIGGNDSKNATLTMSNNILQSSSLFTVYNLLSSYTHIESPPFHLWSRLT